MSNGITINGKSYKFVEDYDCNCEACAINSMGCSSACVLFICQTNARYGHFEEY